MPVMTDFGGKPCGRLANVPPEAAHLRFTVTRGRLRRTFSHPQVLPAPRFEPLTPLARALSFRFSINLFESGSVLPWPPRLNRFVKLYFLVQLTIAARCYPRRIFECAAKLLASAFVQRQPGFTRAALNSAAKRAPRSTRWKLVRFYPCHSPCVNRGAFLHNSIQLTPAWFYPCRHLRIDS